MRDEDSKLSWPKKLVRKWFNSKCKTVETQADDVACEGGDGRWRSSFSEMEPFTIKKTRTAKDMESSFSRSRSHSRPGRGKAYLDHPQILNIQNYSIFVSTWNVGGKSPQSNMNLDDWLHSSPPADIYVLGFQEIVPLNAGNILGAEDNGPAKKWLSLVKRSLKDTAGASGAPHTPSPVPEPVAEWNADFEGSSGHRASALLHRRSFQAPPQHSSDGWGPHPRRLSVCDRVIFGHRQSECSSSHRPSDYSSRWGSEEDYCPPAESPGAMVHGNGLSFGYSLLVRKQMVGLFFTVWARSELREHVRNIKISCVGRGLMGYLGNKGSISISMLLHETSLCFVCSHLTSGQKDGDEVRRNGDVMEILKNTRFPRVDCSDVEKSPTTILEHDRIIWLGDLNYRIALPYRSAKALVEMQNWRALLEKDQLRIEQRRGRVFDGWKEGKIYFPPTYKYSHNSDRYAGDDLNPKEKRRTPAWCDRILWHGGGLEQLSYSRGESRFSDHRPVCSVFCAEIELVPNRVRKSMNAKVEVEELLPYSNGFTELSFF